MFIADDDCKKCNQSDHFCTKFCPHMANINRCPSVALFLKLFSCNWMPPCSHKKLNKWQHCAKSGKNCPTRNKKIKISIHDDGDALAFLAIRHR